MGGVVNPVVPAVRGDQFPGVREDHRVTENAQACPEFVGVAEEARRPEAWLRSVIDRDYAFVWRSLRRFGVPASEAEDYAQEVFVVLSRRMSEVEPGRERGFLYRTALHCAAHARRSRSRRREVSIDGCADPASGRTPEDDLGDAEDLAQFYAALDVLPLDLRAVFILYEVEGLTMAEAADTLQIPPGTVASRLRRARSLFLRRVRELTDTPEPGEAHV